MAEYKKDDVLVNSYGEECTFHATIQAEARDYAIIFNSDGIPILYAMTYIDRYFTLKRAYDPQPGEFYVSKGGSVFVVDQEKRVWLLKDQFDGKHKDEGASHQGCYSFDLTWWDEDMGFGKLEKLTFGTGHLKRKTTITVHGV